MSASPKPQQPAGKEKRGSTEAGEEAVLTRRGEGVGRCTNSNYSLYDMYKESHVYEIGYTSSSLCRESPNASFEDEQRKYRTKAQPPFLRRGFCYMFIAFCSLLSHLFLLKS